MENNDNEKTEQDKSLQSLTAFYKQSKRMPAYKAITKPYQELKIHAEGEYPKELMNMLRPNESDSIKKYRKQVFQAKTKPVVSKILSSLYKIRRSEDWCIDYDTKLWNEQSKITEDDNMQNYCESNFPYFTSVTNWIFNVALKAYLIDPNAIIAVMPIDWDVPVNEYKEPFPYIFNSDKIIDFKRDEYVVLESSEVIYLQQGNSTVEGKVFYIINEETIIRFEEQINAQTGEKSLVDVWEKPHGCSRIPVFQTEGLMLNSVENTFVYESRISGIVPSLNEAVLQWSDLKAEMVQHLHSEKWMYATQDCVSCNGAGKVPGELGEQICPTCKGNRKVFSSPYNNVIMFPPTKANEGESNLPSGAPGGYFEKSGVPEMTKTMNALYKEQIYDALAAINMEFLMDTPLNQSGNAKEVDKDELHNFVHAIAEDIVRIMDRAYSLIFDYRYGAIVTDKKVKAELVPQVDVPNKFSLLTSAYAIAEIESAKKAGLHPSIIAQMEREYVMQQFDADDTSYQILLNTIDLNPFPGKNTDSIIADLQNQGIDVLDYIIFCNLDQFIRRAIEEDKSFITKKLTERKVVLEGYADELKKKNQFDNPAGAGVIPFKAPIKSAQVAQS